MVYARKTVALLAHSLTLSTTRNTIKASKESRVCGERLEAYHQVNVLYIEGVRRAAIYTQANCAAKSKKSLRRSDRLSRP